MSQRLRASRRLAAVKKSRSTGVTTGRGVSDTDPELVSEHQAFQIPRVLGANAQRQQVEAELKPEIAGTIQQRRPRSARILGLAVAAHPHMVRTGAMRRN